MPAYPVTSNNGLTGLTKLEAFTMAAMQALIQVNCLSTYQVSRNVEGRNDDIATAAVAIARATLSELSKNQQG